MLVAQVPHVSVAQVAQRLLDTVTAQLHHNAAMSLDQARSLRRTVPVMLVRLRHGRSRRNKFHALRVQLRALRALADATVRFMSVVA